MPKYNERERKRDGVSIQEEDYNWEPGIGFSKVQTQRPLQLIAMEMPLYKRNEFKANGSSISRNRYSPEVFLETSTVEITEAQL